MLILYFDHFKKIGSVGSKKMAVVLIVSHVFNLEEAQEILVNRKIVLGNSMYCDVVLRDKNIASLQCEINTHKSGHILARNLDPKKDVFINNSRLKRSPIGLDDVVRIGSYNVRIDLSRLSPDEEVILKSEFEEFV